MQRDHMYCWRKNTEKKTHIANAKTYKENSNVVEKKKYTQNDMLWKKKHTKRTLRQKCHSMIGPY
jgi:hypothetical protein